MPDDELIRRLLRGHGSAPNTLDAAAIVRRARARRRPKQIAAAATTALAATAIIVPVAIGASGLQPQASDQAVEMTDGGASMLSEEGTARTATAPSTAEEALRCGAPLTHHSPHPESVTLEFADHSADIAFGDPGPLRVDAALRNLGDDRFTGSADSELRVAVVSDGVVVATSSGETPLGQVALDLAPDGSQLVSGDLPLRLCGPESSQADEPLPVGEYELIAAIDVTGSDGVPALVAVTPVLFDVR